MARKEFTKATKAKAFKRANGRCEGCGKTLEAGRFAFDHIVPDGLGGDNTLENCQVLCSGGRATCHGIKTAEEDQPRMAKADAQKMAHLGISKPKARIPQKPKMKREGKIPLPPRPLYKQAG